MKECKNIAKTLEGLPFIVKLILVLFGDLYANLIRLFRSLGNKSVLGTILAVIFILTGGLFIFWVIDLVCIILGKKIWWLD